MAPPVRALSQQLEDARPLLLDALDPFGVVRIEYVIGFVEPYPVVVWLGVETEAQREAIGGTDPHLEHVREVLMCIGVAAEHLADLETVVQSQESVDRDFDGSWFAALR